MKITKIYKKLFIQATLTFNEDFTEQDITSYCCEKLKELKADSLTRIAKENQFDGWEWSGHIKDNKVEVIFYKVI